MMQRDVFLLSVLVGTTIGGCIPAQTFLKPQTLAPQVLDIGHIARRLLT